MLKKIFYHLFKKYVLKFPSFFQFIKFSLVGVINTFIDFGIYFTLTRLVDWFGEHYLFANALSFTAAVTNSYLLNKFWTFGDKNKMSAAQVIKFLLASLITLVIVQLSLYYLVATANIHDLFSKVLLILLSVALNFTLNKLWVFKEVQN